MNILCMGLPFGIGLGSLRPFRSRHGHTVRTLAADGPADFEFAPEETAAEVVERIGRDWPVDVLFCWVPELFPPPRAIEACGVRTVAALSDWNLYFPQIEHNAARFDLVLTDKLGSRSLKLPFTTPVYLDPLYSHDASHHYDEGRKRVTDVVFAGNLSPSAQVTRGKILERVAAANTSWRVRFESGLEQAEYRAALSGARIVLNYGLRHEMNLRCFESLACGALLFMEHENLEIRDLLTEGIDFVAYTADTLCERLDYFLTHEDERARIAACGAARVREIAGDKRLDTILNGIGTLSSGVRPFRYLSDEQKSLAEILLYGSSRVPRQRDLACTFARQAAEVSPESPALVTASALLELDRLALEPKESRAQQVRHVLRRLQRVTELVPGAVIPWMNLAFLCRRSNAPDTELRFLELALEARATDLAGLLLGSMEDPYYVAWRRGLAEGEAPVQLLHASVHAQLAAAYLQRDDPGRAREHAEAALALRHEFSPPYRAAGRAYLDLGLPERAVEVLREGLQHTSFDAEMRLALLHALHDAGDAGALGHLARESTRLFEITPKLAHLASTFREYA